MILRLFRNHYDSAISRFSKMQNSAYPLCWDIARYFRLQGKKKRKREIVRNIIEERGEKEIWLIKGKMREKSKFSIKNVFFYNKLWLVQFHDQTYESNFNNINGEGFFISRGILGRSGKKGGRKTVWNSIKKRKFV